MVSKSDSEMSSKVETTCVRDTSCGVKHVHVYTIRADRSTRLSASVDYNKNIYCIYSSYKCKPKMVDFRCREAGDGRMRSECVAADRAAVPDGWHQTQAGRAGERRLEGLRLVDCVRTVAR